MIYDLDARSTAKPAYFCLAELPRAFLLQRFQVRFCGSDFKCVSVAAISSAFLSQRFQVRFCGSDFQDTQLGFGFFRFFVYTSV
jgi:hypothetical protein